VIGGDAAHVFPPHLMQGAAMAVEDAIVLAQEVMEADGPVDARA
jgi:2-polyprenyl-6-methoxyphenol hydroxylase-like FAD-dependent oxidoreductase